MAKYLFDIVVVFEDDNRVKFLSIIIDFQKLFLHEVDFKAENPEIPLQRADMYELGSCSAHLITN